MNTKHEEAIEKLLERKGYTIYEIDIYKHAIIIEGSVDYGYQYDFKVDIPQPIVRDEGKSTIDMIIEKIKEYTNDIDKYMREFSEKKEFEIKKYADNVLIDMFEEGMMNGESVYVGSEVVGRAQGKTSTIVYLSKKYGIPVVVSGYPFDSVIKGYDKSLEVYSINTSVVTGIKSRIVLVDEIETRHARRLKEMGYVVIGIVR